MIYTVVDEGYEVRVFGSAKSAAASVAGKGLCLDKRVDNPTQSSEAEIARALRDGNLVRLYPVDGGDWQYRIQRHNRAG